MSDAAVAAAAAGAIGQLVVQGIQALAGLGSAGERALERAIARMRATAVPDSIAGAVQTAIDEARARVREDPARSAALSTPTLPAASLDELTAEDVERIDRAIPTLPDALASSLRRLVDRVEHDARARRAAEDTRPTGIAR